MAEWVSSLAWTGDRTVPGRVIIPLRKTSLRNFGNSVYPALPVSLFIYLFIHLFIMSYLPSSTPSVRRTVLPGAPALHT